MSELVFGKPYQLSLPENSFKDIELDLKDIDEALNDSPLLSPNEVRVRASVPGGRIKDAIGKVGAQLIVVKEYDPFTERIAVSDAFITIMEQTPSCSDRVTPRTILEKDPNIPLWKRYINSRDYIELPSSEIIGPVLHPFKRPTLEAKQLLDQAYPQEDVITDVFIGQFLKDGYPSSIDTSYRFLNKKLGQEIIFSRKKANKRTSERSLTIREDHTINGHRYEQNFRINSVVSQPRRSRRRSTATVAWGSLSSNEVQLPAIYGLDPEKDTESYIYIAAEAVKSIRGEIERTTRPR